MSQPIHAYLVANARYHDTDYARLEILKLLAEDPRIRTTVAGEFPDSEQLRSSAFLVTYTCDLRPTPAQADALRDFVAAGGRWFALHGTNAILEIGPKGMYCPRDHETFMETLGSRFIAHPPLAPYQVEVADPDHPLVKGIEPFEASDELYLCEYYGEVKPLLQTRFTGTFSSGYVENEWPTDEPRLVAYTHPVGSGEVLYLTLGHCCGRYDMRPLVEETEVVRGSWENPVFRELLRRGVRWAVGEA